MRKLVLRLLSLPVQLILWPTRKLWRGLGLLGLALRRLLARIFRPIRAFLGRAGLALRDLILWPVRRLLLLLGMLWRALGRVGLALRRILARIFRPIWVFWGRLGLALRHLFAHFVWRPFLFLTAPFRFIYRRWLHQPLMALLRRLGRALFWVWTQLARGVGWLLVRHLRAVGRRLAQRWQRSPLNRRRLRREWRSRLLVWRARLTITLTQPRPPRRAVVAPVVPRAAKPSLRRRATRWATTAAAIGLVVAASLFAGQQAPEINRVVAQNDYQLRSSKFTENSPTATVAPPTPTATPNASPTPWPTPDPLNGGGSVAFTLRQNGNSDIYALSIGQSQPMRLTDDPADDRDPAWSPDGKKLAFSSRRDGNWELYVLDLESGRLQRLTDDPAFDGGPSWSPDGQWLVFESYRRDNLDLYLISVDGEQGPLRLTQHPAPDFAPAWSPGGRHVAFTSWRSGNKDIHILSLDAAADDAARNITDTPNGQEDHPAFNHDGSALAYSDDSSGFELIYVLPLQDYAPAGEPATRGQGRHPTWSPAGEALSYVHVRDGQSHLIASSLDAWSVAPQAFATNRQLNSPSWSPLTLPRELPERLQAVNDAADDPFFVETVFPPQEEGAPYFLQEVTVNAPAPYLNDRVDQSFLALRERVVELAGWDLLGEVDNLYEPLDAQPLPGLSDRTWNKAGRAFDYNSDYVLAPEGNLEVVREDRGYEIYWRTYLRAAEQDGTQGEPLRDLPWDFAARYGEEPQYYDQGGKWKDTIPGGYYVDFTTLAADYGWRPVPAADNWRTFFPGILFWHYEKRQDLTWEQAMLELYTVEELQQAFSRR
ncbi:MAG: hypothetical protein ACOC9X_05200 [bacterium]